MNFLNLKAILSLNGSGFQLGLKRAESQAQTFAKEIKGHFARAFGVAAIAAYVNKIANMAEELTDLSEQLGVSTKDLQEWGHAAKRSGKDLQDVARFLEQVTLAREAALGGDADKMASFGKLGVSREDLESKTLNDLGRQIASTVESGNIQELISSLRDVGGKAASGLVAALKSINELAPIAPIISDESLENIISAKAELLGVADVIGGPIAKVIGKVAYALSTTAALGKMVGAAWGAWAKELTKVTGGHRSALEAAQKAAFAVVDEWEKKEQRKADNIASRNAVASSVPGPADRLHDFTPPQDRLREAVTRAASEGRPSVNSWQQLGAAVRFAPMSQQDPHSREIAKNTGLTAQKLDRIEQVLGRRSSEEHF